MTTTKERVRKLSKADQEKAEACDNLRKLLPQGSTVYTVLRHVSRSGMMRRISVFAMTEGQPRDVTYWTGKAIGSRIKDGALTVGGCGMDMGFHVAYSLSSVLYRDAFECIGEDRRCPSNDHNNDRILNPELSQAARYSPDRKHSDGGYALRHAWL